MSFSSLMLHAMLATTTTTTTYAARQLRTSLFSLPPTIRASIYQASSAISSPRSIPSTISSRRAFSATAERRLSPTDAIVAGPTALLDAVHALGCPWYAAIPITAVLVRGTLGYYIVALPARRRAIIRRNLYPLSYARSKFRENSTKDKIVRWALQQGKKTDLVTMTVKQWVFSVSQLLPIPVYIRVMESHKTGKEFGAPLFTSRGFFNFAVLIAFVEALRVKCGSTEGLLSLMFSILKPASQSTETVNIDTATQADTRQLDLAELLAQRIEAAQAARQAKADAAQDYDEIMPDPAGGQDTASQLDTISHEHLSPLQSQHPKAYAEFLDPLMQTEGLSWVQDLTVPDPTFGLPLALLTISAARILIQPSVTGASSSKPSGSFETAGAAPGPTSTKNTSAPLGGADPLADAQRRPDDIPSEPGRKKTINVMQRIGLTMSGVFFAISLKLPAGMLLYIIPTLLTGWLQSRWLDIKYPLPNYIVPCARPLRVKVRKQFRDG